MEGIQRQVASVSKTAAFAAQCGMKPGMLPLLRLACAATAVSCCSLGTLQSSSGSDLSSTSADDIHGTDAAELCFKEGTVRSCKPAKLWH